MIIKLLEMKKKRAGYMIMRAKLICLITIILLSTGYMIWKNSTLLNVEFSTAFEKVDNVHMLPIEYAFNDKEMKLLQYDNTINSLDELYEASDVVAIVQPIERKQEAVVVNTTVNIKKNFKSDYKEGENISLFELYYIYYEETVDGEYADFVSLAGYVPMQLDKEYLVFLKQSEGYRGNQFDFFSSLYGKFPYVNQNFTTLKMDMKYGEGVDCKLTDIYEHDVTLFNLLEAEMSNEETFYENENTDYILKYNDYKKSFLEILQALIDNNYNINKTI